MNKMDLHIERKTFFCFVVVVVVVLCCITAYSEYTHLTAMITGSLEACSCTSKDITLIAVSITRL